MKRLAVILGIIIALFSLNYFGVFKFNVVDGCQFIKPEFGFIKCEPIKHDKIYQNKLSSATGKVETMIKCGDVENTPECDFTYYLDCDVMGITGPFFEFQADGVPYCQIGSNNFCKVKANCKAETVFLSSVKAGGRVFVKGAFYDNGILGRDYNIPLKIRSKFIPYGLVVYDSGMAKLYSTDSCSLTSLGFKERINVCVEGDEKACKNVKTENVIPFDTWVNYLSSWSYAPMDTVNAKIVDYFGQKAYCLIDTVYSIGEFRTEGGCYKYPKTAISSVECCPGMETQDYVCENFKWVKKSGQTECFTSLQCPGQGSWTPDYKNGKMVKYQCIDNRCKVVDEKKGECLPPAYGCSEGVCDPEKLKCVAQSGISVTCGDGVCSSESGENPITCSKDCKVPFIPSSNIMLYGFLTALGSLLLYFKKRDVVSLILGGLIGFGTAMIFELIIKNWIFVLLGISVSGIIIYIFGGAILMFVLSLVSIIKGGGGK